MGKLLVGLGILIGLVLLVAVISAASLVADPSPEPQAAGRAPAVEVDPTLTAVATFGAGRAAASSAGSSSSVVIPITSGQETPQQARWVADDWFSDLGAGNTAGLLGRVDPQNSAALEKALAQNGGRLPFPGGPRDWTPTGLYVENVWISPSGASTVEAQVSGVVVGPGGRAESWSETLMLRLVNGRWVVAFQP